MAVPMIGTVVLFSGVQLACIGILGEYIGRIYNEVRERPSYVIREVLDHGAEADARQGDQAGDRENGTAAEFPA